VTAAPTRGGAPLEPLVSVVVPTRNSAAHIRSCLTSLREQDYPQVEIIVVDNHSSDDTRRIAEKLADLVVVAGPERSAQVNRGVEEATGDFVFRVDSDFLLEREVVSQCVEQAAAGAGAVVVHNSPDPTISWLARVRKFEIDMYKYDLTHSAARFLSRELFLDLGGYNEDLIAGEDYDFQNRLNRRGVSTAFVQAEAVHLGEPRALLEASGKFFLYGRQLVRFRAVNNDRAGAQLSFFRPVYLHHWRQFIAHPLRAAGFLFYHAVKFFFGGLGYISGLLMGLWRARAPQS